MRLNKPRDSGRPNHPLLPMHFHRSKRDGGSGQSGNHLSLHIVRNARISHVSLFHNISENLYQFVLLNRFRRITVATSLQACLFIAFHGMSGQRENGAEVQTQRDLMWRAKSYNRFSIVEFQSSWWSICNSSTTFAA